HAVHAARVGFFLRQLAHAELEQRHVFVDDALHDAGFAPLVAVVAVAQIGLRVDLDHAEVFDTGIEQALDHAVSNQAVATEADRKLLLLDHRADLRGDLLHDLFGGALAVDRLRMDAVARGYAASVPRFELLRRRNDSGRAV